MGVFLLRGNCPGDNCRPGKLCAEVNLFTWEISRSVPAFDKSHTCDKFPAQTQMSVLEISSIRTKVAFDKFPSEISPAEKSHVKLSLPARISRR